MRFRIVLAAGFVCFVPVLCAQSEATVAQLVSFLSSKGLHGQSDTEIAIRLSAVRLTEQLSDSALNGILASDKVGPQSAEALVALAAESQLREAPRAAWMQAPAPDAESQRYMVDAMTTYARDTIGHLPDFMATRVTRTFENVAIPSGRMNKKPIVRLHYMREAQRQVTYRGGHEVIESASEAAGKSLGASSTGFESWGEFGPILRMLMSDSVAGSLRWDHWEQSSAGKRAAVFQYHVPKPASHYSIDFCCYQEDVSSPWREVRAQPGYHGFIYFDPETDTVNAITLIADFPPESELTESGLAVQYGQVEIGGKKYVCPVRSVAVSVNRDFRLEAIDGVGLDRHVNVESFTSYHKFGSDARILTANQ
jgi:hypothetical protein